MLHSQGKFCIDRNLVRWTLLDGIINRKTLQDEPMGGQELPIKQVMAVEKATGKKVERLPFGWPAALFGMGLLGVVWWAGGLFVRLVGGLGGLACLYWGAKRIPARTTVLEGYQIVAPGVKQEDWLVLGSTPDVIGFIEGLKSEMARETQALRVQ